MSYEKNGGAGRAALGGLRCCTIIPGRGGSKSVPRKNLRLLAGKPLIAYTIEQALGTLSVERVVVSTDDPEIGAVSEQYGAEVVWRPAELSGDTATSESALLHVLDHLRDTEGYEPDLVLFPQATSPLRAPNAFQEAFETLVKEGADSLFSACVFPGFLWRREGGKLRSLNFDYRRRLRRQDAPEDLMENGSFFIFKTDLFREYKDRMVGKIAVYVMPAWDSFQVDEPGDLELIEHLLSVRQARAADKAH